MKLFVVDVTLEDNTYFEVIISAINANEALDKAILRYPNYVSVGATPQQQWINAH